MSLLQNEKSRALLDLLTAAHAEEYHGLDDDMPDACNDWIADLTDDELCDIVLAVYHSGI